jgi:hypothetical protein
VSRAQTASVSEAVSTTFDGDHPCALCQAVEQGREREQDPDTLPALRMLADVSFVRPAGVVLPPPASVELTYLDRVETAFLRADSPPLQPPRLG